jgi:hypothetical protein
MLLYELKEDVVISTYNIELFLWIIILILALFNCYILYAMYKGKSFRLLNFRFYAKIIFVCSLLIFAMIGLIYKVIIFEITIDSEYASLVFVLLNSLLFNIFINCCFSGLVKNNNQFIKLALFGTLIYITLTSLANLGFRIVFNIDIVIPLILDYKTFEYNTPVGVRFMFYNVGLFIIIFTASLLLEHKSRS